MTINTEQSSETTDSAMQNAAQILANFKGEPDSNKLEQWQACYAALFRQMQPVYQKNADAVELVGELVVAMKFSGWNIDDERWQKPLFKAQNWLEGK